MSAVGSQPFGKGSGRAGKIQRYTGCHPAYALERKSFGRGAWQKHHSGLPKIRSTFLGVPVKKDHSILGS